MATDKITPLMPTSGSNTNGYYTKFPDGTMIQWGDVSGISFSSQDLKDGNKTMPQAFVDTNYRVMTSPFTTSVNNYVFRIGTNPNTSSTFSWTMASNVSITATSRGFNWLAIGRWK